MGVILSTALKPLKKFNIENRAHRIINKAKPTPAPRYPSTDKQLELANSVNPEFQKTQSKRDEELHDRLKQVFISSNVQQDTNESTQSERTQPSRRRIFQELEYGFWEPDQVEEGKCLLRQALKIMNDHQVNPDVHNAESLSLEYKLNNADVENILEYYRVFQVVIPDDDPAKMQIPRPEMKGTIADK